MLQVLNRNEEAESWLRQGIEAGAAPLPDLYLRLGDSLNAKGDLCEAAQFLAKALEEEPENPDALTALEESRQLAALKGVELPHVKPSPEKKHEPGNMTMNIHREFFANIVAGRKKVEYRDATEYWERRIERAGEPPFHLRVIDGMTKEAPEVTVVVEKVLLNIWAGVYEFHLGKVIDVKNWDRENEAPTR